MQANLLTKATHNPISAPNKTGGFADVMKQKTAERISPTPLEQPGQTIATNHQNYQELVQKVVLNKGTFSTQELLRLQMVSGNLGLKQQMYFKSIELGTNGVKTLLNMQV